MDRGHRPLLGCWRRMGGAVVALLPLFFGGSGRAQETPPATATPWVQASPPPGFVGTPTPPAGTPLPVQTPKPPKPKPPKPPKPAPSLTVAPLLTPPPSPSPDEVMREMMHRRAEEQRADAAKATPSTAPENRKEAAPVDKLPPDERAAFQRNLPLWRQIPADDRQAIRRQADERARQEVEKAYQESGLTLDPDQREVFDLRYRQERRKLERELQEKINAERARRLAEMTERLKKEFAGRTPPPVPPAPMATPTPVPKMAVPTPPAVNPDSLLGPGSGTRR